MADYIKVSRALAGLIILVVGLAAPQALAQWELKIGPIYNPASKSYFELRYRAPREGHSWNQARKAVAILQFKGVQGRLAIIDSYATHMFLMENIRMSKPAWIGMYVQCKTLNAYWVNGRQQLNSEINLWHNPWYRRSDIRCGIQSIDTMPVWLLPQRGFQNFSGKTGFRWMATGPRKGDHYMIVEYPTGGE